MQVCLTLTPLLLAEAMHIPNWLPWEEPIEKLDTHPVARTGFTMKIAGTGVPDPCTTLTLLSLADSEATPTGHCKCGGSVSLGNKHETLPT